MARSRVIYLVVDDRDRPVAAFTVKHEMEEWAKRHGIAELYYLRIPDGARERYPEHVPVTVTVTVEA